MFLNVFKMKFLFCQECPVLPIMQMITPFSMQIKKSQLLNYTWKGKQKKYIGLWWFSINCMKASLE